MKRLILSLSSIDNLMDNKFIVIYCEDQSINRHFD